MKTLTLFTALLSFVLAPLAHAAPTLDTFTVQAYMKLASGTKVTDGTYTMLIGIRQNGTPIWAKSYSVDIEDGLFSKDLTGNGDDLSGGAYAATGLQGNYSAVAMTPALLAAAGAGGIVVRVVAVSSIDGSTPTFDIPVASVPTSYIAQTAKSVIDASIGTAAFAASSNTDTGGAGGDAGKFVKLTTGGLLATTMIPSLPGSAIGSGTVDSARLPDAGAAAAGIVSTGAQTFAGAKTFNGVVTAAAAGTGLDVTNNATVGGTLDIGGVATLASTVITGSATVGTTLGVTGATTLGSTLGVTGASTLASVGVTGAATVGTTLGVTGATTLGSTLDVTGASTLASVGVTNNATVGGTLGVTGLSTLDSAAVTNNLAVSGTATLANADVTGGATFAGGVTLSAGSLTLPANSVITSGASGTLTVGSANTTSVILGNNASTTVTAGGTGLTALNLGNTATGALVTTIGATSGASSTAIQAGSAGITVGAGNTALTSGIVVCSTAAALSANQTVTGCTGIPAGGAGWTCSCTLNTTHATLGPTTTTAAVNIAKPGFSAIGTTAANQIFVRLTAALATATNSTTTNCICMK